MTFYAVAIGRCPGVYATWNEAESHVNGFKGAKYRKFSTSEAAWSYVHSLQDGAAQITQQLETTPSKPKASSSYYAVAIGLLPGVYRTWEEARVHVNGFKGAKYCKCRTSEEAWSYVDTHRQDHPVVE